VVIAPSVTMAVRVRRTVVTAGLLGLFGLLLYAKAIPCVFAHVFHVPCPGCGSTRAVVALVHGDLDGVVRYNPLGPVLAALLGVFGVQALVSVFVRGDFRDAGEGRLGAVLKYGIFVVAGLEIVLWVARFFGLFGGPVPVG
jgi:hypothetical protein